TGTLACCLLCVGRPRACCPGAAARHCGTLLSGGSPTPGAAWADAADTADGSLERAGTWHCVSTVLVAAVSSATNCWRTVLHRWIRGLICRRWHCGVRRGAGHCAQP